MVKTEVQTVDDYIAAQPEEAQKALKRVRSIIRKAVPKAGEVISYKIPTYKLHGSAVIFFAGWKKHYSLYPVTDRLAAVFKKDLAAYAVSKGTIRFPLGEPVPKELIARIAKFRADEVVAMPAATPAIKKRAKPAAKKPVKKSATAKKPTKKVAEKKTSKPTPKKR